MNPKELSVNHLLGIKYLNVSDVNLIFETADFFKELIKGYVVCTYVPIVSEVNILPLLKDIDILNRSGPGCQLTSTQQVPWRWPDHGNLVLEPTGSKLLIFTRNLICYLMFRITMGTFSHIQTNLYTHSK